MKGNPNGYPMKLRRHQVKYFGPTVGEASEIYRMQIECLEKALLDVHREEPAVKIGRIVRQALKEKHRIGLLWKEWHKKG